MKDKKLKLEGLKVSYTHTHTQWVEQEKGIPKEWDEDKR
jgi:hypothetical protein